MRQGGSRDRFQSQPKSEKHSINEQITSFEVRVIGLDGAQLGVMRTRDAIAIAEENGVDLVEVSAEAKPPVCRLLDYGKLKYREQKKAAEARKKSSVHVVKELRIRYNTDKHDLETKVRNAKKFLEEGDKVKFEMRFKGRETVYQELGRDMFRGIVESLKEVADVEEETPLLGQKMILVFAPKGGSHAAAAKPAATAATK